MYQAEFTAGAQLPARTYSVSTDPEPLPITANGWAHWLGLAISGSVLIAVLLQIREVNFGQVAAMLPRSAPFWLAFAGCYFAPALSEWVIFRRLWRIPPSGFLALVRKFIGNEILFGYIGEVYFYAWARKRSHMVGAPFGAIKDVAILSAVVGNVVTLVMVALAFPLLSALQPGSAGTAFHLSTAALVLTSAGAICLRRRLFSLPPADLRFVLALQLGRTLVTTGLAALMWHLVLPSVALNWWLLLAALRLLLSRLPFLPNKDLVFAGLAVLVVGHDSEIAALLTMVASLWLATHVLLGLLLMGADLVASRKAAL